MAKKRSRDIGIGNMIRKEILSDENSGNTDSDNNIESSSHFLKMNGTVIKKEASSNSDSDSEDQIRKILLTPEHRNKKSSKKGPVTILQDVRLTPQSPKGKLRKMFPDLKSVETTAELNLSDSDEIHLFRMPKTVDPKQLKNVEIDLENQCKLKLDEKYVVTPTTKVPDPTLVISLNSRVLRFENNIKMEKYIKSKPDPNIAIPERTSVPLPDKLKNRHPLFGSDFQKKIVLSEDVEKKLDEAIKNLIKRQKKSKKKKEKKTVKVNSEERPNKELFQLFNLDVKKEISDDSAFGSSTSIYRGTKKEDPDASETTIPSGKKSKSKSDKNLNHETSIKKEKYISDLLHDISVEMNVSKTIKTEFYVE